MVLELTTTLAQELVEHTLAHTRELVRALAPLELVLVPTTPALTPLALTAQTY